MSVHTVVRGVSGEAKNEEAHSTRVATHDATQQKNIPFTRYQPFG
jgi:hypothetical protein